jgi:hypothetical protein
MLPASGFRVIVDACRSPGAQDQRGDVVPLGGQLVTRYGDPRFCLGGKRQERGSLRAFVAQEPQRRRPSESALRQRRRQVPLRRARSVRGARRCVEVRPVPPRPLRDVRSATPSEVRVTRLGERTGACSHRPLFSGWAAPAGFPLSTTEAWRERPRGRRRRAAPEPAASRKWISDRVQGCGPVGGSVGRTRLADDIPPARASAVLL